MATAPAHSVAVGVDLVRPGLYVRALDRPWIETPFVFQGFQIVGDAEIEALRTYCNYVYVDLGRSDPAAAEQVLAASGGESARTGAVGDADVAANSEVTAAAPAREVPDSPLFVGRPYPERELFRPRIHLAATHRMELRRTVADALARIQKRHAVDVAGAARAVQRLAQVVTDDPTASLWLTRMQAHDDYTSTHAVNCCVLALAFGNYLGLEDTQLERLGLGALLMDVGRIAVPRGVLGKQRELSATEWAFVKRHVTDGVRLLGRGNMPGESLDVVKMHHERVRGHGYPRGLQGERIPWTALMAGLVDSYDAMLRRRPHRGPFEPDAALKVLYDQADATFGRDLVESFIRYLGAYPVGTLVELDNRAIGIVVGNRPGAGLWPTVLLVRDADRRPFSKRLLLNLAAANQEGNRRVPARSVSRTLTPREANVAVGRVVATEFGLGEGY
ncbi:MAG: DUF3391 domain-containing protein [Halofilum sp. (in: g-proteobacteria)]|nr:DUF3391 domain-containing protein [Halofilum sp. (in: g-proteobacteria)]